MEVTVQNAVQKKKLWVGVYHYYYDTQKHRREMQKRCY